MIVCLKVLSRGLREVNAFLGSSALFLALLIAASPVAAAPAPMILEAEQGTMVGTYVTSAVGGYSGSGYVAGFDAAGDAVRWTFTAPSGIFNLFVRFRTPSGQKGYDVKLNGAATSLMFPPSSSFAEMDAGLVELSAGANTLEISGGWNWYEIDRVRLMPAQVPPPPLKVVAKPADPAATLAAKALLQRLASDYGNVTWSGQHDAAEATNVLSLSGKRPIIISGDLIEYSPSRLAHGTNPRQHTESQIALESAGHVLSMCWHWNAPTNLLDTTEQPWWRGFYTEATTFDIAAALGNTNSQEYALVLRDIDAIAVQLRKFATNGIPVLWRPLHEAEGGWFWWGAKGPEPYKKLWRLLFQRLTITNGLHNLIWVLTSEDPAWYPGDDVVDIIGVDAYPQDPSDPLSARWNALRSRFDGRKLIALSEFGGVPDIEKMHRFGVWFAYFAPWSGTYGPTGMPRETVFRIYRSPEVFTLDELKSIPPAILRLVPGLSNRLTFEATGFPGAGFRIIGSPDVAAPLPQWSLVSTGKFQGGVFSSNYFAAPNTNRFFRIGSP